MTFVRLPLHFRVGDDMQFKSVPRLQFLVANANVPLPPQFFSVSIQSAFSHELQSATESWLCGRSVDIETAFQPSE